MIRGSFVANFILNTTLPNRKIEFTMRHLRDFDLRSLADQRWFAQNTWCGTCQKADLGLVEPVEFEESGKIFVEGKCSRCQSIVISEIVNS